MTRWRSPLLGEARTLQVPGGTLELFERGAGQPLVLCHGWLSNANVWRGVVDRLHERFRCVTLDLPLGAHRTPMAPDADLSPPGIASLLVGVLEALDVREATLAGNDSGGAYAQMALAHHPDRTRSRVGGLALTSCETPYDEWPPEPFHRLPATARDEQVLGRILGALRDPGVRASDAGYGLLVKHPVEPEALDSYALPASSDPALLRDAAKVMSSATTAAVRAATQALIEGDGPPVLLVWSDEDAVFPLEHAQRYAAALPDASVHVISDAYSFTPEDAPGAVADAIGSFAGTRASA